MGAPPNPFFTGEQDMTELELQRHLDEKTKTRFVEVKRESDTNIMYENKGRWIQREDADEIISEIFATVASMIRDDIYAPDEPPHPNSEFHLGYGKAQVLYAEAKLRVLKALKAMWTS